MKLQKSEQRLPPVLNLNHCPAKTTSENRAGCTVLEHGFYVGAIASALWERLTPEIQSLLPKEIAVFLAATHDVGKISPGFTRKILQTVAENHPKEISPEWKSLLDAQENWEGKHAQIGQIALKMTDAKEWARAVGMHHGELDPRREFAEPADAAIFGGQAWQRLRMEAISELSAFFSPFPPQSPNPTAEQIETAAALIVVADWLGSDERFLIGGRVPPKPELSLRAEEILDDIGWITPKPRKDRTFADLFGDGTSAKWVPNDTQKAFYEMAAEPGLFIVEAPMGQGKTEAALWGAERLIQRGFHHGIYFALPTRTTSDKIHDRLGPFLERAFDGHPEARLLHGAAWMKMARPKTSLASSETGDVVGGKELSVGGAWFHPSKRALLQSFGVGTIDQALLGVLPVKHAFLRLFGLAGKVVILDEVHSYDLYTGTLLDKLVERLVSLGASVMILSATLTRHRRASLLKSANLRSPDADSSNFSDDAAETDSYPLLTCRYYSGKSKNAAVSPPPSRTIELEHAEWDLTQTAREAVAAAGRGEMVLCVMNTVDRAQELYRRVKGDSAAGLAGRIGLLHGRFTACRREEIENLWLKRFGKEGDRSRGAILVSTQVVEQSVDLDADLLITELAPTDMLLQRLGRLWRHVRRNRKAAVPRMVILYPPESSESFETRLGPNAYVYAPYILWRSAEEWRARKKIAIPADIRILLEATYREREETGEAAEMVKKMDAKRDKMTRLADGVTSGGLPSVSDKNDPLTRYSDTPSVTLLILTKAEPTSKRDKTPSVSVPSGETVRLDGQVRRLRNAVPLHRNSVTKRKKNSDLAWLSLASRKGPIYNSLIRYFFDETVPLLIDSFTGRLLTLDQEETPLFYSDELGLFSEDGSEQRGVTSRTVHDQEEDEGDECFEEFEW